MISAWLFLGKRTEISYSVLLNWNLFVRFVIYSIILPNTYCFLMTSNKSKLISLGNLVIYCDKCNKKFLTLNLLKFPISQNHTKGLFDLKTRWHFSNIFSPFHFDNPSEIWKQEGRIFDYGTWKKFLLYLHTFGNDITQLGIFENIDEAICYF